MTQGKKLINGTLLYINGYLFSHLGENFYNTKYFTMYCDLKYFVGKRIKEANRINETFYPWNKCEINYDAR